MVSQWYFTARSFLFSMGSETKALAARSPLLHQIMQSYESDLEGMMNAIMKELKCGDVQEACSTLKLKVLSRRSGISKEFLCLCAKKPY